MDRISFTIWFMLTIVLGATFGQFLKYYSMKDYRKYSFYMFLMPVFFIMHLIDIAKEALRQMNSKNSLKLNIGMALDYGVFCSVFIVGIKVYMKKFVNTKVVSKKYIQKENGGLTRLMNIFNSLNDKEYYEMLFH